MRGIFVFSQTQLAWVKDENKKPRPRSGRGILLRSLPETDHRR